MSNYSSFKVDLSNPNSTWTRVFNLVEESSVVLDVGCSSGYFDKVLIDQKNCTVDGIEMNVADAKEAAKICRQVYIESIESFQFKGNQKNQYDYILFLDVLEHLIDPVNVLKKCRDLLKKDGCIIFSIPNMAHTSVRLELLTGSFSYEPTGLLDKTHLHFYDKKAIEDLVIKSDYHIVDMENIQIDVPKEIVEKALARVGLTNSPKFQAFLESEEAITYQFVGKIAPGAQKKLSKHSSFKPLNIYEQQLQDVQKDAKEYFRLYQDSQKKVDEMQQQLDRLRNIVSLGTFKTAKRFKAKAKKRANDKK